MGLHALTGAPWPVEVRAPAAEAVELCLFDEAGEERRMELAPQADGHHTGTVDELSPGAPYGIRAHGPWRPEAGLRHNPAKLLVDPRAPAVSGRFVDHPSVHDGGLDPDPTDSAPWVPRGLAVETAAFEWGTDSPPTVPWADTVIYETHVRGATIRHPEVPADLRGTYLGLASEPMIEHFRRLGVTTIELMPVAHHVTEPFLQSRGLVNYWGYSPLAWWAPHGGYATADDGRQTREFQEMVRRLHAAGLEVVVDVVLNHTAEGDHAGPVLGMKGLDNPGWYRLDPSDRRRYLDWTGTGNTVDTSNLAVRQEIVAALRHWVDAYHVDGFRFDLAVTLGRGEVDFGPHNLAWVTDDPVLGLVKLIAEPWDLGPGGYRLGGFGRPWAEWNGVYRDQVRDVWRGRGAAKILAVRFDGSPDLFAAPDASVNLVTAHDGFTLADLVSYERKHNEPNREGNADGHNDNRSWNSGVEGPSDDPEVVELRRRRAGGLLATLLLASGVPMLSGGDELGRSQRGNNNAYCLDDDTTWYDWSDPVFVPLIGHLTALRRQLGPMEWVTGDWPLVGLAGEDQTLAVVLNPTGSPARVELPPGTWTLHLDTAEELTAHSSQLTAEEESVVDIAAWTVSVWQRPTSQLKAG